MTFKDFIKALVRRKYISNVTDTKLERCLTTFDLTFLGVGSTLGLGIYVLAGQVASTKAGPAVTVSFFIAAFASVFSALCYAEFGARVPRAGSAYVYSYVTVGELMAFIIGWNLILEYVIGTASVARGYSGYLDFLLNDTIKTHLMRYMPMRLSGLSSYPDFLSLFITLLLTVMLALGVKESTRFNNIFTSLNLVVVMYAVITGSFKADISNWKLSRDKVPSKAGKGGFLPYGFSGMMAGAATCFYGYVGFDCIATTGEEAKNPQRAIPVSILISLFIVFCAYFGVSSIQTLMWPYYDQNQSAPLPYVFEQVGWPVARWIIAIGALAGLSTSLLGAMFPLPRVLYAMASDGLIYRFLANIHDRFKTPFLATLISGAFAGLMAMMFNVDELAAMMSIGTLLAYTLVATSVLVLRYRILDKRIPLTPMLRSEGNATEVTPLPELQRSSIMEEASCHDSGFQSTCSEGIDTSIDSKQKLMSSSATTLLTSTHHYTACDVLRMVFNCDNSYVQSTMSSKISIWLIGTVCVLLLGVDILLVVLEDELFSADPYAIAVVLFMISVTSMVVYALYRQPMENTDISFKVPYVPVIPFISIFVNIYLMLKLSMSTWIRFAVWMFLGFMIYFSYGVNNSSERLRSKSTLPCIYESATDTECEGRKSENSPLLKRTL